MNDIENKTMQSRREFMSKMSKKAIVGTAAVFLGFGMLKPDNARSDCSGCQYCTGACTGGCTGCEGCAGCSGSCEGSCSGCEGVTNTE